MNFFKHLVFLNFEAINPKNLELRLLNVLESLFTPVFKGFMAGFLVCAFAFIWVTKDRVPLDDIPIIQEFSNVFREGIASFGFLDPEIIQHFYQSDPANRQLLTTENTPIFTPAGSSNSPASPLHIRSYWHRENIIQKFKKAGHSRGKIKAAGRILDYIEQHRNLAFRNMRATNIPVSIKLAQAILESKAGRSSLAKATNNHFGIKAPAGKAAREKIRARRYAELSDDEFVYRQPAIGAYNFHDDHRYDRFEVYASVGDSYQRHNQLLTRKCQSGNKGCYSWIWNTYQVGKDHDISPMAELYQRSSGIAAGDFFNGRTVVPYYAAAAAGLKMAGYATSPTYHKKLFYLIETYELWQFDIDLIQALEGIQPPVSHPPQ